jgi:hypothetical protein
MEMEYLRKLPAEVPTGRVLVHNHVRPARRLGTRGFRAWLTSPDPARLEVCDCSWAPEHGQHFRILGITGARPARGRAGLMPRGVSKGRARSGRPGGSTRRRLAAPYAALASISARL